jgi:hypothetical protein
MSVSRESRGRGLEVPRLEQMRTMGTLMSLWTMPSREEVDAVEVEVAEVDAVAETVQRYVLVIGCDPCIGS